jgi:hypothetical protein
MVQRGLQRRGRELRQAGGFRGSRKQAVGEGCPTTVLRTGGWGPKMRHLVLYKLAGFSHADKTPCARFFPGAMLVTKSEKNTFLKKKCTLFARKCTLFCIFRTKNAFFLHSGGTTPIFCKIAKSRIFANLHVCAGAHFRTYSHAGVHDVIFFIKKKFALKNILKKYFYS